MKWVTSHWFCSTTKAMKDSEEDLLKPVQNLIFLARMIPFRGRFGMNGKEKHCPMKMITPTTNPLHVVSPVVVWKCKHSLLMIPCYRKILSFPQNKKYVCVMFGVNKFDMLGWKGQVVCLPSVCCFSFSGTLPRFVQSRFPFVIAWSCQFLMSMISEM